MNCKQARIELGLLVGHDLNSQSEQQVRRHMAECPHCREHWQGLMAGAAALQQGTTSPHVPRSSLWPAVRAQLPAARASRAQANLSGWFPVVALAAACVGIMVSSRQTPVFDFGADQPTPVQVVSGPPPRSAAGQSALVHPVGDLELFSVTPGWSGDASQVPAPWTQGPWNPTDAPFVKESFPRSF